MLPQGTKEEYFESDQKKLYNHMLAQRISELSQKPNPPFIQAGADMGGFLGGLDAFTVFSAKPG